MELSQRIRIQKAIFDLSTLKPSSSSSQQPKSHRSLLQHMDIKPYRCSYSGCLFQSIHKQNLQRHESVHSNGKRFSCDLCKDYRATTKYTVLKHMRSIHNIPSTSNNFHSATCPANPRHKVNLGSSGKGRSSHFHCTCGKGKTSKSKKSMDLNQRRNHHEHQQQPMVQVGGGKARCPVCSWNIKSNFERHLQGHLESKPFKCNYNGCTFATKHKQNMDRHEIVHTKEKRYSCDLCEYRATTRYTVVKHMRSVHSNGESNHTNHVSTGLNSHNNHHKPSNSSSSGHNLSRLHSTDNRQQKHKARHQSSSKSSHHHNNHHPPQQHQPDKIPGHHHSLGHHQLGANIINNNINIGQAVTSIPGIGNRQLPVVDPTFAGFSSAAAAVTLCNVPYYYPYGVGKPYG